MSSPSLPVRISALALGLLASGVALADAHLDPNLIKKISAAGAADELAVVVTYRQAGPVNAGQLATLKALGIEKGRTMRTLPIAGVLATPAEIRALAAKDDVLSIYWNAPLRYMDVEANRISSATRAFSSPADFGRAIPFSGKGVGVMINDSGIDATHDDLKLGTHVVQNVLAAQNVLASAVSDTAPEP
jgi:serine protease AprX